MLARLQSILMRMTRVLPAVGFGRTAEQPTAPIGRSEQVAPPHEAAIQDQQHVDVPSRPVGQRPRD
ncbi:MAG: hypothetical protein O3A10_01475 [Chloroflexi bacterium]|nr:hypothetical protein [Chloroflexota bacterium]MDA1146007.1 hypothetical protein [Chloroflexota bacterium]